MNEIIIRNQDMPYFVRGQVLLDADGDYNIYINARLSYDAQVEALRHELEHVSHADFENALPIEKVEGLA